MRYLVRHDQTVAEGVCYGWSDVALAVDPVDTVQRIIDQLPANCPIISSPLSRCRLLAEQLSAARAAGDHAPVTYWEDLRELHFGDWEGQPWDQVPRTQLDAWAQAPFSYQLPDGESIPGFIDRVQRALDKIPDEAIVVTHGGVIRAARHLIHGEPLPTAFAATVPFASVHLF